MDGMHQRNWDDVDGVVDMEGELRSTLANLDDSREKHKKIVEKSLI